MLFEIIGLVVAITGLATLARGRGASPVIVGAIALGGWLLIRFGSSSFVRTEDVLVLVIVLSWAWIGAVALYVRFVIGASRPKPDGKWSCSNCHYLNNASAVICEACEQPWHPA